MTTKEMEEAKKRLRKFVEGQVVANYEMNTQDTDWLAANRLKEVVKAGGIGAKAAQAKLDEMENDPQVRPRRMP